MIKKSMRALLAITVTQIIHEYAGKPLVVVGDLMGPVIWLSHDNFSCRVTTDFVTAIRTVHGPS